MQKHELEGILTNIQVVQEALTRISASIVAEIKTKTEENTTKGLLICGTCGEGFPISTTSDEVVCAMDGKHHPERENACNDYKDMMVTVPKPQKNEGGE